MPERSEAKPAHQTEHDLEEYVQRRSGKAAGKRALEQIRAEVRQIEREERDRPKALGLVSIFLAFACAIAVALFYLLYRS